MSRKILFSEHFIRSEPIQQQKVSQYLNETFTLTLHDQINSDDTPFQKAEEILADSEDEEEDLNTTFRGDLIHRAPRESSKSGQQQAMYRLDPSEIDVPWEERKQGGEQKEGESARI